MRPFNMYVPFNIYHDKLYGSVYTAECHIDVSLIFFFFFTQSDRIKFRRKSAVCVYVRFELHKKTHAYFFILRTVLQKYILVQKRGYTSSHAYSV